MFSKKCSFSLVIILCGIILPFIFLKDSYPFHRFGMFAEPVKHQSQYEKFYIFYKKDTAINFIELKPQDIPLNANAFEMQLRKHHYQQRHADFITVFDGIIRKKVNLEDDKKIKWKWYQVIQKNDLQNELDSLCVFSN